MINYLIFIFVGVPALVYYAWFYRRLYYMLRRASRKETMTILNAMVFLSLLAVISMSVAGAMMARGAYGRAVEERGKDEL